MILVDYNHVCGDQEESSGYNINCEDFNGEMLDCNVSIEDIILSCLGENDQTLCTPAKCECTPTSENTASEVTSAAMNDKHSASNFSNSTVVAALGALVGLLLVLLATVSAVLAWTCWLLKKRNGIKLNTEYQLRYVQN